MIGLSRKERIRSFVGFVAVVVAAGAAFGGAGFGTAAGFGFEGTDATFGGWFAGRVTFTPKNAHASASVLKLL